MAHRTDMTIKLSLMAVVAYGVLSILTLTGDLQNAKEIRNSLADEAEMLKAEISEFQALIGGSGEAELIEEFAEDELAMARAGEVILRYK